MIQTINVDHALQMLLSIYVVLLVGLGRSSKMNLSANLLQTNYMDLSASLLQTNHMDLSN